uniref:Tetratricopeptide repeat protein n=1 Tax=candidate division WOR-3 bacterium TaxID=2052148 RepID=A0A7C4U793_UNCW3
MIRKIFLIFFLILFIFFIEYSFERKIPKDINTELLYFPKGENVKYIVSGFNNLLADLLWIRGAVYYGDEKIRGGKFEYLYHIYDIITSLDKRFLNGYIFGSFFINYQLKNLKLAIQLLDKGIRELPDEWVLHFYKGFMYYISYDFENAYKSFLVGSKFEKNTDRCKKFAYMSLLKEKGVQNLLYYWKEMYEKSNNIFTKEIAVEGMKECIRYAMKKYERERKKSPKSIFELLKEKYIPFIPVIENRMIRIEKGEVIW